MMKEFIREAIRGVPAEFVEVRIEDTRRQSVAFRGKDLTQAQETRDSGGYVRVLVDGVWGFLSFNRPERLKNYTLQAVAAAKAVGGGTIKLAPAPVIEADIPSGAQPGADPREVSLLQKVEEMRRLASYIVSAHDNIISSSASCSQEDRVIHVANSDGTYIKTEGVWCSAGVGATARDGNIVQGVHKGFGTRHDWRDILKAEDALDGLIADALDMLNSEPVKGGRTTVILDPRMASVFIHEAFGHLSEADNVATNEKLAAQMKIGAPFGRPILNVLDGGNLHQERGSFAYDDEGVPSSMTYLIKDGILAGRLHSRETAGLMNEALTGNARTIHYRFPPICRMSNTFIDAGQSTFDEMLDGVADGLYVVGSGAGNTSTGLFTFSAERARVIKNGKLGGWVRDLMMTGDVFETLNNIDMVGNDLIRSRAGGCGKSYGQRMQYPLAVSMGSPHIRIQNLLIGGR